MRRPSASCSKLTDRNVTNVLVNMSRPVGIMFDGLPSRHTRQNEDRPHAGLGTGKDIGVHAVADHERLGRMGTQLTQGGSHHEGVRFADEVGLAASRQLDWSDQGTTSRLNAVLGRASQVDVGGDESAAPFTISRTARSIFS